MHSLYCSMRLQQPPARPAILLPRCLVPPSCRRAIAAELARRLMELVGWLSGRVSERRLRGFERAYFALRRWHVLVGA